MSLFETDWQLPLPAPHSHGGADAFGAARFDFSSNANAAGPLPSVAAAVLAADRRGYPDPAYSVLRQHLGRWHGVSAGRIVPAASASEFIHRFTRAAALWGGASRVLLPRPGYGDYAAAAGQCGLAMASYDSQAVGLPASELERGTLAWVTEPISPSGATRVADLPCFLAVAQAFGASVVLDLAYQPLRFDGGPLPVAVDSAWQLCSPNKACGLTGVRAAYAIAPLGAEAV
ncbi:MAG: aminotransferase class I/II-fold pyridoxal phosphate-dependent enzyme, partial [Burkholderiaceae bacterium]